VGVAGNERDNISDDELEALKTYAADLLNPPVKANNSCMDSPVNP